ncbi:PH domain-containing protein [Mucilaginibacter conchicola]|uniref:PH domain-containing protein n=1 Tax=Mucilaginibacter conchicola TaxID=2303333 RepID=A0A372NR32_9SPHI|nr:PH domain-containing protein [Mucilaginibacter conchicola]RFZ91067.1 PH domain-containing protein [Mucilaginibacter conchicola]
MKTYHDISLRPAVSFAVLKNLHLIALSLIFLLLAWYSSACFVLFSLTILCIACYRLLWIRSNHYLIGAETIRTKSGIFFKRSDELKMYSIKDYVIIQPIGLQVLKLMNVTLKSTDPETPVLKFTGIPRSDLIATIRERVNTARQNKNTIRLINQRA